jgi:hypothetical protein
VGVGFGGGGGEGGVKGSCQLAVLGGEGLGNREQPYSVEGEGGRASLRRFINL